MNDYQVTIQNAEGALSHKTIRAENKNDAANRLRGENPTLCVNPYLELEYALRIGFIFQIVKIN